MEKVCHVVITTLALISHAHGIYKLCAFPSMDSRSCDLMEEGNSNVSCVRVTDSVECSWKMKSGQADFALYHADEAVLAAKRMKDSINVIGEARYKSRFAESSYEDMVVVARNTFSGNFAELRNKGYCHPGIGISHKVPDRLLKSFEQAVLPEWDCSNNHFTAAEQEIRNLESFFGPSCRPGRWAADDDLDNRLKRRYRNMCMLCESPSQCSNSLFNNGLGTGALDCLTANGGDVAFASTKTVNTYFGLSKGPSSASPSDYVYLCPNETVMPLTSTLPPCLWASQPWDLFVARTPISGSLQDKLNIWLSDTKKQGSDRWQANLRNALLKEHRSFISRSTNSNLPINQYFNRGVVEYNNTACNRRIKWCTTSDLELEKCMWIQAATDAFGSRVRLYCSAPRQDKWICLKAIAGHQMELVSISTDRGFIAKNVYNLSTLFYEDNLLAANFKILTVLRKDSSIRSYKDLRNKKACFPEYNGLAWIAFTNIVKSFGLLGKQCPETFFSEACAPGAMTTDLLPNGMKPRSQLCNLCPASDAGNCSPQLPRADRNLRALQCLDASADVAFINLRAVSSGDRTIKLDPSIDPTKYSVLCRNGTVINNLLNADDSCSLAGGTQGEVVGRRDRGYVEDGDSRELLLQLNKWFGTNEDTTRNTINIYGPYRGQDGLMFEDNTLSLVHSDDDQYDSINSYKKLLNSYLLCSGASLPSTSTIFTALFFTLPLVVLNNL